MKKVFPSAVDRRFGLVLVLALGLASASGGVLAQASSSAAATGVKLADIKIEKTFERVRLTKENFNSVMSACSPTYPESAKDKFLAEWPLPLMNSSIVLAHSKTASFLQIRGDDAICVLESENRFPIVATEVFKKTATAEGVSDTVMEDAYIRIAKQLAERGYVDVAYLYGHGAAYVVTFTVSTNERGQLHYLNSFRKKEYYQPIPGSVIVELPDKAAFSTTRYANGMVKSFISK